MCARVYRVSNGGLQRSVLLLLAADVVEGKEDVMVVVQGGWQLNFGLIMKIWRAGEEKVKITQLTLHVCLKKKKKFLNRHVGSALLWN